VGGGQDRSRTRGVAHEVTGAIGRLRKTHNHKKFLGESKDVTGGGSAECISRETAGNLDRPLEATGQSFKPPDSSKKAIRVGELHQRVGEAKKIEKGKGGRCALPSRESSQKGRSGL